MSNRRQFGQIYELTGVVREVFNDRSISVHVPSLGDEPLEDVKPEFAGPMLWRPREGREVRIWQRVGAVHPERALSWVGPPYDPAAVPDYADGGKLHILSELGQVLVALVDAVEEGEVPLALIGTHDAEEPLVCGELFKAWAETLLDALADGFTQAAAQLSSLSAAVLPVTGGGGGTVTLPVLTTGDITAAASACASAKASIDDFLSDLAFTAKEPT
ncbi:MAG: hypothetical protein ACPGQD_01920 [Planctomycetota bacterium]